MSDNDMIGGLYPKPRNERAPDFVIGKGSFNVKQFREWMQAYLRENPNAEWINFDMKISKAGKGYAVIDTWKPDQQAPQQQQPAQQSGGMSDMGDDIPFSNHELRTVI